MKYNDFLTKFIMSTGTTTIKPIEEELHCKICNTTFLYLERFYIHSLQHLRDNMNLLMNKTTSTKQKDNSELTTEQIEKSKKYEVKRNTGEYTDFTIEERNHHEFLTTLKKRSSDIFSKNKYFKNRTILNKATSLLIKNLTKLRRDKSVTYNTSNRFLVDSAGKNNNVNNSYLNQEPKLNFNKSRRYNFTQGHSKGQVLKTRNNKNNESRIQGRNLGTKCSINPTGTFEPEMVKHIKKAALWVQQKERKKDPESEVVVIVKLDKKAHMRQILSQQQRKLVSLEKILERNSSSIYRYLIINNTIVNNTPLVDPTPFTVRSRYTIPLCFITEPRIQGVLRRKQYTNDNFTKFNKKFTNWKRYYNDTFYDIKRPSLNLNYSINRYNSLLTNLLKQSSTLRTNTFYFNRNLYKNFNYSKNGYVNMLERSNKTFILNDTGSLTRSPCYNLSSYKNPTYNDLTIIIRTKNQYYSTIRKTFINKNLYKNMNLSKNIKQIEWNMFDTKRKRYVTSKYYLNNANIKIKNENVGQTSRSTLGASNKSHRGAQNTSDSTLRRRINKMDEEVVTHVLYDTHEEVTTNGKA